MRRDKEKQKIQAKVLVSVVREAQKQEQVRDTAKKALAKKQNSSQGKGSNDQRRDFECYYCKQKGHIRRNCPSKAKDQWIEGYSEKVKFLYEKLTTEQIKWVEKDKEEFRGVKEALTAAPVLSLPDVKKPFQLFVDGWPTCVQAIVAVALLVEEAKKATSGAPLVVFAPHNGHQAGIQFRTGGNNLADQEAKTMALMTVNPPEIKGTEVPDDPPQPSQEKIEWYEKIGGKLKEDTAIRMAEKGWTHASRVKKVEHQEEAPEWKNGVRGKLRSKAEILGVECRKSIKVPCSSDAVKVSRLIHSVVQGMQIAIVPVDPELASGSNTPKIMSLGEKKYASNAAKGRAMPPARPRPRAGLPRARPRPSRRGLASARLWPYWRWRCWAGISAVCGGGIAALRLRLARARPRPRGRLQPRARPRPRPLPGPAEDTGGAAAAAASAAASPARAPPLGSAAAGPEPPVPRCEERRPGHGRPGAAEGRSGAVAGPGPSADSRVPPAGTAPEALQERYRLGSLLGRGGFGSVFAATRLSDGAPVAIKRVPRNRVRHWGELPDGSRAPLEIVLQAKVSTGFPGVVQLLEWFELPNHIVMVMERPERCQDLHRVIRARRFVPEEVARELFRQVLEAVWHCTSCGVLHRDIKPENIVLDLATGQAKLIDFGCGTYLQETAYTHFAGTPSYSPPEWNDFGWYHGEAATIWSLGILLHQMVCGEHPFRRGRNLSWGQLPLPQGLSQECQDLIRWCLSVNSLERPTLEDLFSDPWVQDILLP
ncbi:uncharacterized protein [Agelaius tricolor]|uniref:uncharacterized protein n=1 Tax=Agelaius tricolor TaxID=9191 RepID=UPI0039F21637